MFLLRFQIFFIVLLIVCHFVQHNFPWFIQLWTTSYQLFPFSDFNIYAQYSHIRFRRSTLCFISPTLFRSRIRHFLKTLGSGAKILSWQDHVPFSVPQIIYISSKQNPQKAARPVGQSLCAHTCHVMWPRKIILPGNNSTCNPPRNRICKVTEMYYYTGGRSDGSVINL